MAVAVDSRSGGSRVSVAGRRRGSADIDPSEVASLRDLDILHKFEQGYQALIIAALYNLGLSTVYDAANRARDRRGAARRELANA